MVRASWSTPDARWTLEVEHAGTGGRTSITCGWLFCAAGYYRHEEGFTAHFDLDFGAGYISGPSTGCRDRGTGRPG